jgi:hypothetical protein
MKSGKVLRSVVGTGNARSRDDILEGRVGGMGIATSLP